MNTIKVNKAELLEILVANLKKHESIYEKAFSNFRKKAIKEMEKNLKVAQKGGKVDLHISLPYPENHSDDYKRVIGMLQMSIEDSVSMTDSEYQTYVQDQWHWQRSFVANTVSYAR